MVSSLVYKNKPRYFGREAKPKIYGSWSKYIKHPACGEKREDNKKA